MHIDVLCFFFNLALLCIKSQAQSKVREEEADALAQQASADHVHQHVHEVLEIKDVIHMPVKYVHFFTIDLCV